MRYIMIGFDWFTIHHFIFHPILPNLGIDWIIAILFGLRTLDVGHGLKQNIM